MMKSIFPVLFVFTAQYGLAQNKAVIMSDTIKGKVTKVVYEFFKLEEDKSGKLIKTKETDPLKNVYFFDDNNNMTKWEYWFDYSSLDPSGKTKPLANTTIIDPEPVPPKYDTTFINNDTSTTLIVKRPNGDKEYFHTKIGSKKSRLIVYEDKDGKWLNKRLYSYDSLGRVATKSIYCCTAALDSVSMMHYYDEQGNEILFQFFDEKGKLMLTKQNSYKYDSHGNFIVKQMKKWDEDRKEFVPYQELLVTYYYAKKQ
jgi:hypothetical protein